MTHAMKALYKNIISQKTESFGKHKSSIGQSNFQRLTNFENKINNVIKI